MQTITISISDTTYDYIKSRAQTSVECRAGAMLDLSVQQEIEKYRDDRENVPMQEILLMCPKCCAGMLIGRDDLHPRKAEIEVQDCPQCWNGDFNIPRYFDEDMNEISPLEYEHLWKQERLKGEDMKTEKFEQWAVVELFGHQRIAGLVSEQVIGGCSFVRVDVPENGGAQGYTKLYGNGAIYAMTFVDEETGRAAAKQCSPKPIDEYSARRMLEMMPAERRTFRDLTEFEVETNEDFLDDD